MEGMVDEGHAGQTSRVANSPPHFTPPRVMAQRRYSEEEVAQIIEAAVRGADEPSDALGPAKPRSQGMSLAEIQEIGAEVGIPAHAIAASAAAIDVGDSSVGVTGTTLGVPHGVAGTVPLPRELTDREWEILVGHLRETFNAIGKTESEGGMRSWRNGNLQFRVEPTSTGTVHGPSHPGPRLPGCCGTSPLE